MIAQMIAQILANESRIPSQLSAAKLLVGFSKPWLTTSSLGREPIQPASNSLGLQAPDPQLLGPIRCIQVFPSRILNLFSAPNLPFFVETRFQNYYLMSSSWAMSGSFGEVSAICR